MTEDEIETTYQRLTGRGDGFSAAWFNEPSSSGLHRFTDLTPPEREGTGWRTLGPHPNPWAAAHVEGQEGVHDLREVKPEEAEPERYPVTFTSTGCSFKGQDITARIENGRVVVSFGDLAQAVHWTRGLSTFFARCYSEENPLAPHPETIRGKLQTFSNRMSGQKMKKGKYIHELHTFINQLVRDEEAR